jgi:NAD+ synthase
MTSGLRIVVAQLNATVGDVRGNLIKAQEFISQHSKDADLIVFPESFLAGYQADDLVLNAGFIASIEQAMTDLAAFVRGGDVAVLIGAPEAGPDLPFNAAHLLYPDGVRRTARKVDLPNDGPFDEKRVFAPGELRKPFLLKGHRIGVVICEEMWHRTVTDHLAGELADVLIAINGSPYSRGKHKGVRLAHARRRVRETGLPLIYCNLIGGQDELVYDGASFALQPDGTHALALPAFEEAAGTVTILNGWLMSGRPEDFAQYPSDMEADYAACVLALRDYVEKNRFPGVVLGISGGIDSALVGAIAVDALGRDRVQGITMPSRITTGGALTDAHATAAGLGIKLVEIPIADMVAAANDAISPHLAVSGPGITGENLQARARMIIVMAWSNQTGLLPLTTGNKSEGSVGYSTIYGDAAGGFNPIKDIYKFLGVWPMAKMRNQITPPISLGGDALKIPETVIAAVPSAGLAEGQTDEATLGPYEVLDALLVEIIDNQSSSSEAARRVRKAFADRAEAPTYKPFLTVEHAAFVGRLVRNAEFKRRQAAPGPKIGPLAFGRDRRYPITNRHEF